MAYARLIIVIDSVCCQMPDVREFPPSSVRFLGARRTRFVEQRSFHSCTSFLSAPGSTCSIRRSSSPRTSCRVSPLRPSSRTGSP
eukprot:2326614-Pyramimonas_sp.AAC.1